MKIFGLSILAGAMAWPAPACDVCAVYSATQAHGEVGKGFFTGVAEQFTHFGTLQEEGVEMPNVPGQFLDSSIAQVFVGYNFNDRIGVQFTLPIVHRSFRRADDSGTIQTGRVSGIGDSWLASHFVLLNKEKKKYTFRWSALAGLKFPTGNSSRLEEETDELTAPPRPGAPESGIHGHDLTLGSGSVDGVMGTGVFARWQRVFLTGAVQYTIRSKGDFEYHFANDLTWLGGPGFFVALHDEYSVRLQAAVSGEHKKRDTLMGMTAEDTGLTAVYVGPQLRFTWSDKLSADLGVDLPVSINNTALQIVPDYRVRAGLTWHF